jgi:predicted acetyltransferase
MSSLRRRTGPRGFAIVRGLGDPVRVLSSFFVVRSMRRAGVGLQAAGAIVALHPGRWEVAFQEANAAATRFCAVRLATKGT